MKHHGIAAWTGVWEDSIQLIHHIVTRLVTVDGVLD
jgi:hypothetical protein